jgi:RNA polymerase primary sigma factor
MVSSSVHNGSLSAIEQYLREVKQTPPLSDEEEAHLLRCIEQGNVEQAKHCPDARMLHEAKQAQDRLVAGYQPLLISLARRYVRHCREMDLLDLVQEGNVGLLQALEKYDRPARSTSFRTWAFSWARGLMLISLWQYEGAIQLPLEKARAIRQMGIVNTRLLSMLGHEPSISETAKEMGLSEHDVRDLIVLQEQQVVSIHAFPDDDPGYTLEDVIADPGMTATTDEELRDLLKDALAMLPDRERLIVNLRYGFEDGQAHTQKEVAYLLGVTVKAVAAVDRRAQLRLRKLLCTA